MRLGVLEFASVPWLAASVLDPLRAHKVDVITGDSIIVSLDDAIREAKRLARADCDGVLLLVSESLPPENLSAAATLLAGAALLLAGHHGDPAFFESVGTLEAIGARFDRVSFADPNPAASLEAWLQENGKPQRHRGLEAARKLYGQRLHIPLERGGLPDTALWMHQFGIIATTEAEGADFAAPAGDPCGALTGHLLSLISGSSSISRVPVTIPPGGTARKGDTHATFARITRIRGRFRCLLLRGILQANGVSVARFDCADAALFTAAASPWLHAVTGDHRGAIRAACDALDIDTVLL